MATTMLPHSPNGAKAGVVPLRPAKALAALRPTVDRLHELRALIRQAEAEERRLTAEVLGALTAAGADQLEGDRAVARIERRTTLKPDVGLFLEAVGRRGYEALTVGVTAARRFLGADDLAAISETTTTTALRVQALAEPAPAA